MNFHHHYSSGCTKEDLVKELNLNYKTYLENLLLFQTINEIINEKKFKSEKLFNRFWKSCLQANLNLSDFIQQTTKLQLQNDSSSSLSSSSASGSFQQQQQTSINQFNGTSQCDNLINQLKLEDFEDDLKKEFLVEIEQNFENYLNKIENIVNIDGKQQQNLLINLNTSQEECVSSKIKHVVYANDLNAKQIAKLNDDICVKLKSYLNLTHEIVNLLIKMISEYKLGFYLRNDLVDLESILFKCDMILAKIETVLGECLLDTYSKEKLKCLNVIKENICLNQTKCKEKYEGMKNALSLYKSIGGEFEAIHKDYIQLKTTLDQRKWTLNKLKNLLVD